jgi:hypothetical protein
MDTILNIIISLVPITYDTGARSPKTFEDVNLHPPGIPKIASKKSTKLSRSTLGLGRLLFVASCISGDFGKSLCEL